MKVSVVIPIYNQENYLHECLNSVVAQDYNDYEVILVNDGSTDNSEQICFDYIKAYGYFQYIYQKNKGLGEARNTGLAHSMGQYILFLDSDDAIQKNCIAKLLLFAEENSADIVYFDEIVCDEKLNAVSVARTYSGMEVKISKTEALKVSMQPSHICARLYRRELFDNIWFSSIWYEDMEIFPRLLKKASNIFYYKVPIYYYRQHNKGITYQEKDKRNLEVITAWHNAYTMADYTADERKALRICILNSMCTFMFFRPDYAADYMRFYNKYFSVSSDAAENRETTHIVNIRQTHLWQQADFYGQTDTLNTLICLERLYQYGGVLYFHEKNADFQYQSVKEESIIFSTNEGIALQEIRAYKGNPIVFAVLSDLSNWNLISLRNQLKELSIEKIFMEKALLYGVRIEGRNREV